VINTAETLAQRWTALGAMFNVSLARGTPDLERLLLDTVRLAHASIPPFVMAVTWLAAYGELVARHRLARLVGQELEAAYQPAMALLLDTVIDHEPRHVHRFHGAIAVCRPARRAGPLLDIDRKNKSLARLAEQSATVISRKWGLWLDAIELKFDALRPPEWIAQRHPALALRALVGGDLVASVLAEAQADSAAFKSEVELARRCGASRPAIREAIAKLRLAGYATQERRGRRNEIHVRVASL